MCTEALGSASRTAARPDGMDEKKKEENEAEIHEHGPEHWFSKWERQCLAEAERDEPVEEDTEESQQKLWHLFQNSATAVAQLYKGVNQATLSIKSAG